MAIKATMPSICRLCGKQEENIFHIIASCSYFSSNHYLHARHNPVAKEVYHEFTTQTSGEEQNQKKSREMPSAILKVNGAEVWWDRQVTTLTKIPHNKLDIIIWDGTNNECKIIDICVPLDTNLELMDTTKRNNYVELVDQLQRIYPKYKYYHYWSAGNGTQESQREPKESGNPRGQNRQYHQKYAEVSIIGNTQNSQELSENVKTEKEL